MSALAEPGQESLLLSSHGKAAPKVLQSFGTVARGARSGSGSGDRAPFRPAVDAVGSGTSTGDAVGGRGGRGKTRLSGDLARDRLSPPGSFEETFSMANSTELSVYATSGSRLYYVSLKCVIKKKKKKLLQRSFRSKTSEDRAEIASQLRTFISCSSSFKSLTPQKSG